MKGDIPILEAENPEEAAKMIHETLFGYELVGLAKTEQELKQVKVIICKMVPDWVQPYKDWGNKIPIVLFSTHPRYTVGTRLDWGFTSIVLKEGYTALFLPHSSTGSTIE